MSELLEKFNRINYLPIFPLPVVLMPNELLPLHIFEPRYRKMLKDIQLGNSLFGLSYFSSESSDNSRPEIGTLGCVAEVRETQPLEDGRSNILTVGIIRYRLVDYLETDEPYLTGEISAFEDYESDDEMLHQIADEVYKLFKRVALAAHKLSGSNLPLPEIPQTDPQALSFLISAAISLPPETKYAFLEMRSTTERLEKLQKILKQSVEKIEDSAKINKIARTNGHSNKKIDLS